LPARQQQQQRNFSHTISNMSGDNHTHGSGGLYCGGEWIDMEDCDELLKNPSADACKGCKNCHRHSSSQQDALSYDVVIIGAGCIGGAIARELSKYTAKYVLFSAEIRLICLFSLIMCQGIIG
jgi:hypothetical protein